MTQLEAELTEADMAREAYDEIPIPFQLTPQAETELDTWTREPDWAGSGFQAEREPDWATPGSEPGPGSTWAEYTAECEAEAEAAREEAEAG